MSWVLAVISCCVWMLRREAKAPAWTEGPTFSGPTMLKENFAVGIQTPLPSIYCACRRHSFPLSTGTLAWTLWAMHSPYEFFLERQISPQVPWQNRKIRGNGPKLALNSYLFIAWSFYSQGILNILAKHCWELCKFCIALRSSLLLLDWGYLHGTPACAALFLVWQEGLGTFAFPRISFLFWRKHIDRSKVEVVKLNAFLYLDSWQV